MRHLKVGILGEQERQDRQKDKDGNHRRSQALTALTAATGNTVAVEGHVATSYTVDRGAEAAFCLHGWYTLRLSPGMEQRNSTEDGACCGTAVMTREKKKGADAQIYTPLPPSHSPMVPSRLVAMEACHERAEETFRLKWPILSIAKPSGKNKAKGAQTCLPAVPPSPLLLHQSQQNLVEADGIPQIIK